MTFFNQKFHSLSRGGQCALYVLCDITDNSKCKHLDLNICSAILKTFTLCSDYVFIKISKNWYSLKQVASSSWASEKTIIRKVSLKL